MLAAGHVSMTELAQIVGFGDHGLTPRHHRNTNCATVMATRRKVATTYRFVQPMRESACRDELVAAAVTALGSCPNSSSASFAAPVPRQVQRQAPLVRPPGLRFPRHLFKCPGAVYESSPSPCRVLPVLLLLAASLPAQAGVTGSEVCYWAGVAGPGGRLTPHLPRSIRRRAV